MEGIKHVKGQTIQIVTMLEVLVATLSGVLLLGEKLTLPIVLGGFCILSSIFVASYQKPD
ncbi:hypothetical protein A2160_05590 [Candidatus Beckwithbacteria bacterium RBG_13_42_9]|uniref:EamA domain-containing protein n=1 Tax=Candidatus Beckwithbacteria bacterium RBG_13_42_9 TaxID=1797457 RepID=A0A1F5E668_9BACT|nr:MAG: hypothetical protein A2160_05590 [Candidatus Beckwithbacteria bacterium RBG_13_42_9]